MMKLIFRINYHLLIDNFQIFVKLLPLKPLAKRVLIPLELTVAASVANAGIHKNILGLRKQN